MPRLEAGQRAVCAMRHDHQEVSAGRNRFPSHRRLRAGALVLYWPAILLPVLHVGRFGHHHSASILSGAMDLLRDGSWFVGGVVLLFSVVLPLAKLLLLLELSLVGMLHRKHQSLTYRIMEAAGRWSMLDVLLLAFLVMLVKLGSLVEFEFGPAVIAFALCVAMSMLASLFFDPHAIWEE